MFNGFQRNATPPKICYLQTIINVIKLMTHDSQKTERCNCKNMMGNPHSTAWSITDTVSEEMKNREGTMREFQSSRFLTCICSLDEKLH